MDGCLPTAGGKGCFVGLDHHRLSFVSALEDRSFLGVFRL